MHTHTYTHARAHTHAHAHTHARAHTHTHRRAHAQTRTHARTEEVQELPHGTFAAFRAVQVHASRELVVPEALELSGGPMVGWEGRDSGERGQLPGHRVLALPLFDGLLAPAAELQMEVAHQDVRKGVGDVRAEELHLHLW